MVEVEDAGKECTVPSGMLKFGDIEEQGRRLHNSQASLECIAAEFEELVEEQLWCYHYQDFGCAQITVWWYIF